MRILLLLFFSFCLTIAHAQAFATDPVDREPGQPAPWKDHRLNTAARATYMTPAEREMVYELNRLRSNPKRYIQYLRPYLAEAKAELKARGAGHMHYSITTHYMTDADGRETTREDTTWHDMYREEVRAIEGLIDTLAKMKPLRILKPDPGIYKAAQKHARDEARHNWELGHRGSDGSWPNDRITKFAPHMEIGNENLAGSGKGYEENEVTPREIVILLLIDSGIPSYGHRWNILNPNWTHVATHYGGWSGSMHHWVQEFGRIAD